MKWSNKYLDSTLVRADAQPLRWWAVALLAPMVVMGIGSSGALADEFEDHCVLLAAGGVPLQAKIVTVSTKPTSSNPPTLKLEFSLAVGDRKLSQRFNCWQTTEGPRVRQSP